MTLHKGIRRDVTDVHNDYGMAHYVQNARFRIMGEVGRRAGMGKSSMAKLDGPVVLIAVGIDSEPFIVQVQDDGTVTTTRNPTPVWVNPHLPPPIIDPNPPPVQYAITVIMAWVGDADLDLYGSNDTLGEGPAWFSAMSSGGLTLNVDAHPNCNDTAGPEIITGTFTDYYDFSFWYDQYSNCEAETSPLYTTVAVQNTGASDIVVNGDTITPGRFYNTSGIAYAGYDTGGSSGFGGGTIVSVTAVP